MIKMNLNDPEQLVELHSLQHASYKIEAELIGFADIPPLLETADDLKNCGETFYGYKEDGKLAGAIAVSNEEGLCTICRLIVHPDFFRRGIGSVMVSYVCEHLSCKKFIVSTGTENHPARRLYEKHGFTHIRDEELAGLELVISHYEKTGNGINVDENKGESSSNEGSL
ncbi:GNAT family N-acetyltransferase [Pseudalkalibacillus decolorationis]|uniref:GNAT family N-acetyltransferase n=1 Tax=Pseudalkalibacillus decolorationis TaxID=163879 RepID=UPI00214791B6|nr:GNAT family N-acetyltransferase [Pseudalkalibacillus decolorationis]